MQDQRSSREKSCHHLSGGTMQRSVNSRILLLLCVLGMAVAGCAKNDSDTQTPVDPIKSGVHAPMTGYWPLAPGNVWEFSYSHTWLDAGIFAVGAANSGSYTGAVRWHVVDTSRSAEGFEVAVRERFIGQAVENQLVSDQPVTWQTVTYAVADSATTFTLTIHADGTLSIVNHPIPSWGRGEFPGIMLSSVRVPPANTSSQTLVIDGLQCRVVLTRGVGPSSLSSEYIGNTHRRDIKVSLLTYTIVGG